jgi:hypothetical protein
MRAYLAISTTVAFAATAIYQIYHYHNALYNDSIGHVISSPRIPAALAASTAVRIVNPQNHVPIHDTRYIKLSLPKRLTDEEILARFVKGFFGGYVFGPERGLLRANGKQITRFEGKLYRIRHSRLGLLTHASFAEHSCRLPYMVCRSAIPKCAAAKEQSPLWCVSRSRLRHRIRRCIIANI